MWRRGLIFLGLAMLLAVSGCASVEPGAAGEEPEAVEPTRLVATTTVADPGRPEPEAPRPRELGAPRATLDEPAQGDQPSVVEDEPAAAAASPADDAYPVRVRIPDIDVDAEVIDLGLNPDGTLEVPEDFDQTGWYTGRSVPGNVGPSVVVGHVDSKTGPEVFYRLRDLEVGHTVEIHRSDGFVALFRVSDTTIFGKDEFPTNRVYGATAEPTLRLVTCGGEFDRSVRSYKGNLIVYAEHLGNFEPTLISQPG